MKKTDAIAYSAQAKMGVELLTPLKTKEDLSCGYTPGIAEVSKLIQADEGAMFTHTFRRNNLAVISDGSAVLGLGNIGHTAAYPVMEGKAMLFKRFGNIDAIPLIIGTQDVDEFITVVERVADSFGAINLEDISAPRCFAIERALKKRLSIPVMHDDQWGTAVVVTAVVRNIVSLTGRKKKDLTIVISGVGAAGSAVARLLIADGVGNVLLVDSTGIIVSGRLGLEGEKKTLAKMTNTSGLTGGLADAMRGADVFIGLSRAGLVTPAMVRTMAPDPAVIAMANPVPEIMPDEALAAGAAMVATGRSDFPNQVNNALAFPAIFRAAIDMRRQIDMAMLLAAVEGLVAYHRPRLAADMLLPSVLDDSVYTFVADRIRDGR